MVKMFDSFRHLKKTTSILPRSYFAAIKVDVNTFKRFGSLVWIYPPPQITAFVLISEPDDDGNQTVFVLS
jgi:hypothetical protein